MDWLLLVMLPAVIYSFFPEEITEMATGIVNSIKEGFLDTIDALFSGGNLL